MHKKTKKQNNKIYVRAIRSLEQKWFLGINFMCVFALPVGHLTFILIELEMNIVDKRDVSFLPLNYSTLVIFASKWPKSQKSSVLHKSDKGDVLVKMNG